MRTGKFDFPKTDETPESPERRDFLKTAAVGAGAAAVGAGVGGIGATQAQAQSAAVTPWWPSRWGPEDQAGASNWITPEKVLDSVKWIRDGKIYRIGRTYESGIPAFGARTFALRIPGSPTGGPFGDNKLVYNDEFLATEIGQIGTQFDGLGHIGTVTGTFSDRSSHRFYNGFTGDQVTGAYGLDKLGVENIKPLFTRSHLIDVMGFKGAMMDAGQEISLADVRGALAKQNMNEADIKPGDGVFFNTGWGSLWMKNNDRFNSGEPGIGMEVARWLVEKQITVTGADQWATEVVPNPNSKLAFVVHQELITKNGIHNHENLTFDALLADRKYQFVYVFAPMPIKGATGSAGSPIAIT